MDKPKLLDWSTEEFAFIREGGSAMTKDEWEHWKRFEHSINWTVDSSGFFCVSCYEPFGNLEELKQHFVGYPQHDEQTARSKFGTWKKNYEGALKAKKSLIESKLAELKRLK